MAGILEVTTMIGCPLACTYCPQGLLKKNYSKNCDTFLSLENFKIILEKVPKDTAINFCGYSEPFSNPNCLELIKHTFNQGYELYMHTTLQGASLEAIEYIYDLSANGKISKFVLHLPDGHKNMPGFKLSEDYLYGLGKIAKLEFVDLMTMSSSGIVEKEVYKYLKGLKSTSILKRLPRGWRGVSRANNLKNNRVDADTLTPRIKLDHSVSCGMTPFYDQNTLLPNGDVALCCMDYGQKHIIGNLLKDSYNDLFKSDNFLKLIEINRSQKYSEDSLCKSCESAVCHTVEKGKSISKSSIERNGRRTTELSKSLQRYRIPFAVSDKIVDATRWLNRLLNRQ